MQLRKNNHISPVIHFPGNLSCTQSSDCTNNDASNCGLSHMTNGPGNGKSACAIAFLPLQLSPSRILPFVAAAASVAVVKQVGEKTMLIYSRSFRELPVDPDTPSAITWHYPVRSIHPFMLGG